MAENNGRRNKLSLKTKRSSNKQLDVTDNDNSQAVGKIKSDTTATEISWENESCADVPEESKHLEELIQKLLLHRKEVFANWKDSPDLPSTADQISRKEISADSEMQADLHKTENWTPLPPSNYVWRCKQPQVDLQTYYGNSRNYETMSLPVSDCENEIPGHDSPNITISPFPDHLEGCEIIPDSPKGTALISNKKTKMFLGELNKQKDKRHRSATYSVSTSVESKKASNINRDSNDYKLKCQNNDISCDENNERPSKKARLDFLFQQDSEDVFVKPKASLSHQKFTTFSSSNLKHTKETHTEDLAIPSTSTSTQTMQSQLQLCPLCQLQFPARLNQMEIDEHIAVCLSTTDDDLF